MYLTVKNQLRNLPVEYFETLRLLCHLSKIRAMKHCILSSNITLPSTSLLFVDNSKNINQEWQFCNTDEQNF